MKKTLRRFFAAALCGMALTSCSQDIKVDDPVLSSATGARVIEVSLVNTTKSTIDGLQPSFVNGDKILVSNGRIMENCQIVVSGDKAWFSTELEGSLDAVYPASAAYAVDLSGNKILGYVVKSEQSGNFEDANIAMAKIEEGSNKAIFENQTLLFKITTPKGTKKLSITSKTKPICKDGNLVVVGDGTKELGTCYVSLLPESDVVLSDLTFNTGLEAKAIPSTNPEIEAIAGTMYTIDENSWIPEYLPGKFSVSSTKQVQFSKGNLQATYDGSKYTWGFAANQYDYIGDAAGNTTIDSQTSGAVVDLFGWPTSATNFGISTSENNADYSGDFVDWGKNIGDGSKWSTLTTDEWQYLFNTRTNASSLYKTGVTVCGKANCLIIAPDGSTVTIAASYDATTWPVAEAAGLVCLPTAGNRYGSEVYGVGGFGDYWSSSVSWSLDASSVWFDSSHVNSDNYDDLHYGNFVRLITESN